MGIQQRQFVEVRGRPWLVEAVDDHDPSLTTLRLPAFVRTCGNKYDHTYQDHLFWRSDYRDEVFARLIVLNAERHAKEARLGIAPGMKGKDRGDDDDVAGDEE